MEDMLPMFIGMGIVGGIFILIFIFGVISGFRQDKSVIERAKKIDPTVKTLSEAHFVLHKDLAENFGKNKDN